MEDLKERILFLLSIKRCSVSALAGGNGSALQQKINRQLNGNAALTADVPVLILKTFSDISPEWLMLGDGNMYRDGHVSSHTVQIKKMSGGTAVAGNVSNHIGETSVYHQESEVNKDSMISQLIEQNNRLIQFLTSK